VITTRRYTNPRLPLPLPLHTCTRFQKCDICAVASVTAEQPAPSTSSFGGIWYSFSNMAFVPTPTSHYTRKQAVGQLCHHQSLNTGFTYLVNYWSSMFPLPKKSDKQICCRNTVFTVQLRTTHVISKAFLSVCLSVYVSVRQSNACIITEWKKTCPHILYQFFTSFLVFLQEEWMVAHDFFYLKFWIKLTALERNRRFSIDIRS